MVHYFTLVGLEYFQQCNITTLQILVLQFGINPPFLHLRESQKCLWYNIWFVRDTSFYSAPKPCERIKKDCDVHQNINSWLVDRNSWHPIHQRLHRNVYEHHNSPPPSCADVEGCLLWVPRPLSTRQCIDECGMGTALQLAVRFRRIGTTDSSETAWPPNVPLNRTSHVFTGNIFSRTSRC